MSAKGLILMYHRVADASSDAWGISVSPQRFAEQLRSLRDEFEIVPLSWLGTHFQNADVQGRWVAVTFDDGYADNLYQAKPLLERYDVPATVFVVSSQIGSPAEFWWDEIQRIFLEQRFLPSFLRIELSDHELVRDLGDQAKLSPSVAEVNREWRVWQSHPRTPRQAVYLEIHDLLVKSLEAERTDLLDRLRRWAGNSPMARPANRVLNADELIQLRSGGQIEIGSHGATHTPFHLLRGPALLSELSVSKAFLEGMLSGPVTSLSYPFGSYVPETFPAVHHAGYQQAFGSLCHDDLLLAEGAPNAVLHAGRRSNAYAIPRVMVEDWSGPELTFRLTRWFGD